MTSARPALASRSTSGNGILASSNILHLGVTIGLMEYWSRGVMGLNPCRVPVLHYSNTLSFQSSFLPEHLPKLPAPAFQLFVARQPHHNDLIVSDVLLELVLYLGMKDIFAKLAENSLWLGAEKKVGEQFGGVWARRLPVDGDKANGRQIFAHAH